MKLKIEQGEVVSIRFWVWLGVERPKYVIRRDLADITDPNEKPWFILLWQMSTRSYKQLMGYLVTNTLIWYSDLVIDDDMNVFSLANQVTPIKSLVDLEWVMSEAVKQGISGCTCNRAMSIETVTELLSFLRN